MHVVMVMVVDVVVMMMVVVMMLHRRGFRGRGGGGVLRDGVAGEANGQSGGDDKALDHGRKSLSRKARAAFAAESVGLSLNTG
jgi:hypothetical protein